MWEKIVGSYTQLHERDIIPIFTLRHKVGCGSLVHFWMDDWVGNGMLRLRYNRLFHLDSNPNCIIRDRIADGTWSWNWIRQRFGGRNEEALLSTVAEIGNVSLSNQPDSWHWSINPDGIFMVNAKRNQIDDCLLPSLPNRLNLSIRGLEIPIITYPSCNAGVESNDHIFFGCDTATVLWRLIRVWVDVSMTMFSSCSEWFQWVKDCRASKVSKDRVYVITATTLWMLWRYQNGVTFNSHPMRNCDIFDNIRLFSWLKCRGRKVHSWNSWLNHPL
ncbi:hypothetical protein Tco_1029554 [Tanacetum coccineum]|uniref:Reverse transcriptase zinc-binding domain-containing protein n=1 Tax=Tanacetum coccineum TaxID=301880 RepID=A0ABQ5G5A9_9ASTR